MSENEVKPKTVAMWLIEIADARKREKDFRKSGKETVAIYEAEESTKLPYNILFSNTETLQPALYNQLPQPTVVRRFKDEDPLGLEVSKLIQRSLAFLLDSNDQDYSEFDGMMKSAVLEALIPGRGITRFKYDADIKETEVPSEVGGEEPTIEKEVVYETVCGEEVPWDRIFFGYAKRWSEVPWLAFEHFMSKEEVITNFGEDFLEGIDFSVKDKEDSDDTEESKVADSGETDLAQIYEVWDKSTLSVKFIASSKKDSFLKEVETPPKISGFFPIPRPLQFNHKITSLVPVAPYKYYEEQALELNRITIRINKLIKTLKVRGFYNSTIEDIDELLKAEDNRFIPAGNIAALEGKSLDQMIWLFPLEKIITVLQQLYLQREQVKAVIYDITGIADIMRGSSKASETLGAQQIKTQWGSLRLRKMQREVQRYARDCLRIIAELAVSNLSQKTLEGMTGLKYPNAELKQQAQQMIAQAQQTQQSPPKGVMEVLQLPTWDEIQIVLDDKLQRNYRIDIETNSTIDAESSEDKADVAEFLNAVAQFMNGALPLVESGVLPFEAMKSILMAVVRRFRFGPEVEKEIKKMTMPKPQEDGAEAGKKAEAAGKAQLLAIKAKTTEAEAAATMTQLKIDGQVKAAEAQAKIAELKRKDQLSNIQFEFKVKQLQAKERMLQIEETSKNADVSV